MTAFFSPRRSLFPVLLAGFALYQWQARRCERAQLEALQAASKRSSKPEVSTWEGEGGALKHTGAQLGPDPVPPVQS